MSTTFSLSLPPQLSTNKIEVLINKAQIIFDLPLGKFRDLYEKQEDKVLTMDDGYSRKGQSSADVLKDLKKGERGLTVVEGVWFVMAYPEVLDDHAIDLLGSKYSIECIPTIYKWKNKIHLSAVCPDVKDKMCGAPIIYSASSKSIFKKYNHSKWK